MELVYDCSDWSPQKSPFFHLEVSPYQSTTLIGPLRHWYAVLSAKLSLMIGFMIMRQARNVILTVSPTLAVRHNRSNAQVTTFEEHRLSLEAC
jgi:hypothetical protein